MMLRLPHCRKVAHQKKKKKKKRLYRFELKPFKELGFLNNIYKQVALPPP